MICSLLVPLDPENLLLLRHLGNCWMVQMVHLAELDIALETPQGRLGCARSRLKGGS